jgi:NAD(P)-dependent dehydrogenase (short-subunit alcohol dehydrogenase family)
MAVEIDLTGHRALVTGGGQGVGEGIALLLAQAGAEVVVNDIVGERAQAVVDAIEAAGGKGIAAPFDLTDLDAVKAGFDAFGGGVDILVNNAGNAGTEGFGARGFFWEVDTARWEAYVKINLYAVLHTVHTAVPGMIEKGWGRLITVTSDAGRVGDAQGAVYSAAKAGAAGFMRSIAREAGRYGITANSIALGTMNTVRNTRSWTDTDDPQIKAIARQYIIRRPGEPSDVANMALYLASEGSEWVTGQTFPVNGGFSVNQ